MTVPGADPLPGELIRDRLLPVTKIPAETRRRLSPYLVEDIRKNQLAEHEADGWVVDRELKYKLKMRKEKAHDIAFEDRVWATLARLQFPRLNSGRSFRLRYGAAENKTQQVDVFAADDEVVLIVECKSTTSIGKPGQFKAEIEAITGRREGILKHLRHEYPQHKVKFLLATNNYTLSDAVRERIEAADVFHIDEDAVEYYLTLAGHLGAAAKYQLLGALFAGQRIPNLEPTTPAIRAAMGGHTYYSFAIEPARLLKMAYVLHRNQANSALMPTYQRIIKKSRLKKVAEFIDNQGFFPNSIVVNIETARGKGDLNFDFAGKSQSKAKLGLLHLPQTYRAAYIIDGQHRLYGYAKSDRADTDLIPVVAFIDLPREKQVELFMQVNENQQAVPKNLRNTLNADLLWSSEDYTQRARALRLHVAQHLGEQKSSPLYDRVIIGENTRSTLRCITIDAINNGLVRGNFIGTFTKTAAKEQGTFYAGGNQPTAKLLLPFLAGAFRYLGDGLPAQYARGNDDGGFVFINVGVESILRVLSDIVDHLKAKQGIDPLRASTEELLEASKYFLDPLIDHLDGMSSEEGAEYRKSYGAGGRARYYRRLQEAIREKRRDFDPPGLEEYLKGQDKENIAEAREIVGELEAFMKHDIRQQLEDEFAGAWESQGIPRAVRKSTAEDAIEKNLDLPPSKHVTPWDCMYLINYHDVLAYSHPIWQKRFEKRFTRPGDEQLPGTWKNRLAWIKQLNETRNRVFHAQGIGEDDQAFLIELRDWLLRGEIENDL